jgi:hypothetical protein
MEDVMTKGYSEIKRASIRFSIEAGIASAFMITAAVGFLYVIWSGDFRSITKIATTAFILAVPAANTAKKTKARSDALRAALRAKLNLTAS